MNKWDDITITSTDPTINGTYRKIEFSQSWIVLTLLAVILVLIIVASLALGFIIGRIYETELTVGPYVPECKEEDWCEPNFDGKEDKWTVIEVIPRP